MIFTFPTLSNLQLDIVGIVAVLGEDAVRRSIQVSCLSWYNCLPRLMPAPQALARPEKPNGSLPFDLLEGRIVNTVSGHRRDSLNFFCSVLHPQDLPKYGVELLEISLDPEQKPGIRVRTVTPTLILSLIGACLSIALLGLSIKWQDGFAFISVLLLSCASSALGFASRWVLLAGRISDSKAFKHDSSPAELVIYCPEQAAFRIIHCSAKVAHLYFATDRSEMLLSDSVRRWFALVGIFLFISGLIFLGNAEVNMKIAFTAAYVFLNVSYWGTAIINPVTSYWKHTMVKDRIKIGYDAQGPPDVQDDEPELFESGNEKPIRIFRKMMGSIHHQKDSKVTQMEGSFQGAIWRALALTTSTDWIETLSIVPSNDLWWRWLAEAEAVVNEPAFRTRQAQALANDNIGLVPDWDYSGRFTSLFRELCTSKQKQFPPKEVVMSQLWTKTHSGLHGSSQFNSMFARHRRPFQTRQKPRHTNGQRKDAGKDDEYHQEHSSLGPKEHVESVDHLA